LFADVAVDSDSIDDLTTPSRSAASELNGKGRGERCGAALSSAVA